MIDLNSESLAQEIDRFSPVWEKIQIAAAQHNKIALLRGENDYYPDLCDKMAGGVPLAIVADRFLPHSSVMELIPNPQLNHYHSIEQIAAQIHSIVTSFRIADLGWKWLGSPDDLAYKACTDLRLAKDAWDPLFRAFRATDRIPPVVLSFKDPPPFLTSSAATLFAPVVIEPAERTNNSLLTPINIIIDNKIILNQDVANELMTFFAQPLTGVEITPLRRMKRSSVTKKTPQKGKVENTDPYVKSKRPPNFLTTSSTNQANSTKANTPEQESADKVIKIEELEARLKERGVIL